MTIIHHRVECVNCKDISVTFLPLMSKSYIKVDNLF